MAIWYARKAAQSRAHELAEAGRRAEARLLQPLHIALVGLVSAGKSTLLNALAGEKLAIVSPKPQTTRNRVLGVLHVPKKKGRPGAQVVLIDTPGVHRAASSLGRKMMAEVREALNGCDLALIITDAAKKSDAGDDFLLDVMKGVGTPHLPQG